jgi:hypothetical protein
MKERPLEINLAQSHFSAFTQAFDSPEVGMKWVQFGFVLVLVSVLVSCSFTKNTPGTVAGSTIGPITGAAPKDLTINISGLPAGVAANIAVTGPNNYAKLIKAGSTLKDLPAGTYTIRPGLAVANGTAYNATPTLQTVSLPATDTGASVTINYVNYSQLNVVVSNSTCDNVAVGTSCTISLEVINNTQSWASVSTRTYDTTIAATDFTGSHLRYVSASKGPLLSSGCNVTAGESVPVSKMAASAVCSGGVSFTGNGVWAVVTVQRTATGLSAMEAKDSYLLPVSGGPTYTDPTLVFLQ